MVIIQFVIVYKTIRCNLYNKDSSFGRIHVHLESSFMIKIVFFLNNDAVVALYWLLEGYFYSCRRVLLYCGKISKEIIANHCIS